MSQIPYLNRFLFLLFSIFSLGIFLAALALPDIRQIAYAPLREALLPEPDPIVVTMLYSTEKEAWLTDMVPGFTGNSDYRINGHPIEIQMEKMGSREMVLDIVNGEQTPVIFSPASSLQVAILQNQSTKQFGSSLVDPTACPSVVHSPLVLVAWKERADVLWGDAPPADLWPQLHEVLVDPQGWSGYGHPEWGFMKFGHTSPLTSNSGFMTILLMTYGYFGKTSDLTANDLFNPAYQQWFLAMENTVSAFGDSTGTYMEDIVKFGPSTYDMVAVYEATMIEQAENASGRYGELRVYYPPATLISDHPFCVLEGDWVTEAQAAAAHLFIDYLQSETAQETALLRYGFRPTNAVVALDQPGSPFTRYAANGIQITLPPQVAIPSGDVLDTLLDFWSRNIR